MVICFSIGYKTGYGEDIQVKIKNGAQDSIVELQYNNGIWEGCKKINPVDFENGFSYSYERKYQGQVVEQLHRTYTIFLKDYRQTTLNLHNEWISAEADNELLHTRPFDVLLCKKACDSIVASKSDTHQFSLSTNIFSPQLVPCISGACKTFGNWNGKKPLLLEWDGQKWASAFKIKKKEEQVQYKLGVYNKELKQIIQWEAGENRILPNAQDDALHVLQLTYQFNVPAWKGAGLNVQLSSLVTKNNWGVGEFTDLPLLVDLVENTGLKLIQLLPINDTTGYHSAKDSYPYSAISAFALHPMYLGLAKLAKDCSYAVDDDVDITIQVLKDQPRQVYEDVLALKWLIIKNIFEKEIKRFRESKKWLKYFEANKHWLQPYAAFCTLRDRYKTPDFNRWGKYAEFSPDILDEITDDTGPDAEDVLLHYFIQYHLHLQLVEATKYAAKKGVVFKADLPIGVGRCSVETWTQPGIFHMQLQAGAPPDAFAKDGQNWSFPTYNWEAMEQDNYKWWGQRMQQLSNYFDAVRIDHILGFFRIWAIPVQACSGTLGYFTPALGYRFEELKNYGLHQSLERYVQPHITENIIQHSFTTDADLVKKEFLNGLQFKKEFNTQQQLKKFIASNKDLKHLEDKLLQLQANVLFVKDEATGELHPRIAVFDTISFKDLPKQEQEAMDTLYHDYFFKRQDALWMREGVKKLDALKKAGNNMLLCGEDLGMVPRFVPSVLHQKKILSLNVERMPKSNDQHFSLPAYAGYDAVVTPSTHDMSTMREWWEEDRKMSNIYFYEALGNHGEPPYYCEPWLAQQIVDKHLQSPAMWSIFLIQDLLALSNNLRFETPAQERINIPANPNHIWDYKMHISLADVLGDKDFCALIKEMVQNAGR